MTSDGASWVGLMRDFRLEIRILFQIGRKSIQKSSIKRNGNFGDSKYDRINYLYLVLTTS